MFTSTSDYHSLQKYSCSECSELLHIVCGFSEYTLHLSFYFVRIRGVHVKRLLIPRTRCEVVIERNIYSDTS